MASSLNKYLQDRAREDFQNLVLMKPLVSSCLRLPEHLRPAIAYALMHDPKQKNVVLQLAMQGHSVAKDLPEHIDASKDTLVTASYSGLNLAGEACKIIERTRPGLITQYPDFPWIALKRLRDYFSHPERFAHDPERRKREEGKICKELDKFFDSIHLAKQNGSSWPPIDDDATRALMAGVRLFGGLQLLYMKTPYAEQFPLTGTPEVREACNAIICE